MIKITASVMAIINPVFGDDWLNFFWLNADMSNAIKFKTLPKATYPAIKINSMLLIAELFIIFFRKH